MAAAIVKLLPLALVVGGAFLITRDDEEDLPPGGVEDWPETGPPEPGANVNGHKAHQIRYGDLPYYMAEYYTGYGARFRELDAINPHILPFANGEYAGWIPGNTILLPKQWKPWGKPLPPPMSGGGAPQEEEEEDWGDYPIGTDEDLLDWYYQEEMAPADYPEDYVPEGE